MRALKLLAGALLALIVATPAHAYNYRVCNTPFGSAPLNLPSNSWQLKSSDVSFPAGIWQDGLNNAISQFNKNPSNFFYTRVSDTNGLNLNNGESEVWGSSDQNILQGAPAIAYSWWNCFWFFGVVADMKEGDVIFDYTNTATNPFEWTPTRQKNLLFSYSGSGRLLQGTAIHEFGHAAGLLHVNTEYNVMGTDFTHLSTNGITANGYIGEDTGDGLAFLYGLWAAAPQDLGVVHWYYTGASGEYSTHGRTRIFNPTTGLEVGKVISAGEPRYTVKPGKVVSAEFTFENNGRSTQSGIVVNYYVSTNDTISTGDRLIGSSVLTLSRDNVLTTRRTLVLPTDLLRGTNYWLGAIINPAGAIAESDLSNNATYIGMRTIN